LAPLWPPLLPTGCTLEEGHLTNRWYDVKLITEEDDKLEGYVGISWAKCTLAIELIVVA
jgi:hypothetical protein